jgi:hypothetical protein
MMRELAAGLIMGVLVFAWSSVSYAIESSHLEAAIGYTKAAISAGKMGQADVQVEHAKQALEHLEIGGKAKSDSYVIEATEWLQEAIEQGNMGHADIGTKALEEAVKRLEMAYKEWDRPGGCPEGPPCKDEDVKQRKK